MALTKPVKAVVVVGGGGTNSQLIPGFCFVYRSRHVCVRPTKSTRSRSRSRACSLAAVQRFLELAKPTLIFQSRFEGKYSSSISVQWGEKLIFLPRLVRETGRMLYAYTCVNVHSQYE